MKLSSEMHHNNLALFEGTWHTTGQVLSGESDGQVIEGLDTYEWLPGKHFMMHTVDVLIGNMRQHSVEIIGYNDGTRSIIGRSFNGLGRYDEMSFDLRGSEILINGADMRFNGRFSDDFGMISGIWEKSSETGWSAVMEMRLEKRM